MRKIILLAAIFLFSFRTFSQPVTFSSTAPIVIPDFPSPGIQSDINVSGIQPNSFIANPVVSVCFNITHPTDGELQIALRAPDMSQIYLSLNNGGNGDNYTGTCFVPIGALSIVTGNPPFTGNFLPQDPFSPAMDFSPINGVWSLMVSDLAAGDSGTVQDWSITFNNAIGIQEIDALNFSTFPNPATSELVVQSSEFVEIEMLEIYSSLGEKIFSQQPAANSQQQIAINVSPFVPGIYFITVTDQTGNKVTKKVVKM